MKTNQDYKNAALAALKGNWTPAALLALILIVVMALVDYSKWLSVPLTLLLLPFTAVGVGNAFRLLSERRDANLISNAFHIGSENYVHKLVGTVLMEVYIFLWTLLLIVPGIIKSFAYAMTPYILEEHPELSANEAIDKSQAMMRGHKFDLFYLYLGFVGWAILSCLTCGIGFIWLVPYVRTTVAGFYYDLKVENGEELPEAEVI